MLQLKLSRAASRHAPTVVGTLHSMSGSSIRSTHSLSRGPFLVQRLTRQYSTFASFGPLKLQPISGRINSSQLLHQQRRTLFGWAGLQSSYLGHLEQTANSYPSSAFAQYHFLSACMRAGHPNIVVQRVESGQFATSGAIEELYKQALTKVGGSPGDLAGNFPGDNGSGMSAEQRQAIGQAIAARARSGKIASTRGGSGAKDAPLYVVVEETMGSAILKWVKLIASIGISVWACYTVLAVAIEVTGISKTRAGRQNPETRAEIQKTRFSDVHGCDEAKEELQELVEFLKAPEKFSTLGGKLPKGVLLVGPPGTGKTLLARAVAGEAGVPFFYMSGSEFDEVYVGVGAKRVRELFSAAREKAPSIVFIDELDAIGGKRNERDAAYVKQTLNQLLTDLDGFEQDSGVIFLAATNFPELLDKALVRPGRFDRQVHVQLPDVRGRVAILKHHMRKIQLNPDVDAAIIARGTPGCSGAELENIVNQAAVHASKAAKKAVDMSDFEWAKDRIMMGAERRSAVIQDKDKLMTAYHEGGHALVAMFSKHADPLYKATIMPRGHALGITFQLPEMDRVSYSKRELLARIDVCMGGKVAEELIYGDDNVTTGASSDIQVATRIAYAMITEMGFSEILGNVDMKSTYRFLSPKTREAVDKEVRQILADSKERARQLLVSKRTELDLLARGLMEYESLNKDEMEKVVRGEKLPEKKVQADQSIGMKIPEMPLPLGIPTPGGNRGARQ